MGVDFTCRMLKRHGGHGTGAYVYHDTLTSTDNKIEYR